MVAKSLKIYISVLGSFWIIALGAALAQSHSLFLSSDIRFSDFTIFDPRFRLWSPSTTAFFDQPGFPFPYPAPTLAIFLAFWNLTPNALLCFLATVMAFALASVLYLGVRYPSLRFALGATLLGSFPLFFLLDRANIEGAVWIAATLGVTAFAKQRFRIAAVLLGLAASMKIFPALLILLFLARKRYREAALAVLSAALFTIGSLAVSGPTVAVVFARLARGLDYFRQNVILQYLGPALTGFDHSAFSLLKQILHVFFRGDSTHSAIVAVYLPYLAIAAALFAVLYAVRIRTLPLLNQLFTLTVLSITLPFVSFDYTLVHIYIPFTAFLIALSSGGLTLSLKQSQFFLIPCAILFAPFSWMQVGSFGFSAQVKTLALFALLYAALRIPLPTALFGELKPKSYQLIVLPTLSKAKVETVS